jgi:NAD(P)-dependent dehydrogenase (short-subunit alcohol dehydrogenase family)
VSSGARSTPTCRPARPAAKTPLAPGSAVPGTSGMQAPRRRNGISMDLQLAGKRAVVTGGSRGVGFAIAAALVGEGTDLALLARDPERLGAAARQLAADHGRRVLTLPADTTDDTAVRAAIARTADELGGVAILVNNAAVPAAQGSPRALADLVDGDLLAAIVAKVLGYLCCARRHGRAPGPDRDRAYPGHDRRIRRRPRQDRGRGRGEPGRGHQRRPHRHRGGGC